MSSNLVELCNGSLAALILYLFSTERFCFNLNELNFNVPFSLIQLQILVLTLLQW